MAVTANTEPAHGTAVFNQDHSITYTPDADYNGADSFNYTVSDGAFTDTASVTLTVTPVEDSPRFQDQDGNDITGGETSRNVDENTPTGRNIGKPIAAVDPDGQSLAFALGNSDDDAAFAIDDTTGQIKTKASLDFEDKPAYRVTVTATDTASNSSSVTVDISVNDRNETPSFDESSPVTRSVDENVALGTNMGAPVTATDQDAGSLPSYSLLSSHDANAFSIDTDSGQISVDAALDQETQERYAFQVSASDGFLSAEIEVVVTILNVDEPPVAQDDSITTNEDTAVNIPVLENDTDVDTDRDNLVMTIQDPPAHGTAAVQADQTVQYTPEAEYSGSDRFTYRVSDGTGSDEASVSVTIDAANDRPVFDEAPPQEGDGTPEGSAVTRAVAENTPAGQNIGEAISASDAEDDRLTYGFTGADSTQFDIDADTGQLKTKEPLNYEDKFNYTFEVTVSDGKDEDGNADPSIDSSISVTVTVTDANDAPVANDDSTNVDEDSGDTLHIVSATDPSHGAVTINDGGTLTYVPEANFNGADSFGYTLSDGELSDTGLVQITVNPVQDSPDFEEDDPDGNGDGNSENLDDPVTREIAENTPSRENIGDPVTVTATDPDDDTLTYSLAGPDSASFSIDAGNGQLRTKDPLNYELKNSYSVTVVATDPDDNAASVDVTINVTDVNDAPTFTEAGTTARTVAENSPVGTNVGIPVTATDEDTGSSLTYSLGGLDVADFEIDPDNGQLITGTYLDHEAKSSYQLIVSVDDGEHTAETRVTVAVDDLAEPPAAPSPPIVTTEGKSSLRATWATPDNTGPAISGYQVRYQAVGSGTWTVLGSSLTATEVLIPGLAMNQHYQVQVQAVNEEGSSPWSTSGLGSTAAGPPNPPGNFRATPSNPSIYLTWDTPTTHGESITGYQYQRSEDRGRTWSGGWMTIPGSVPGQTNSNHYVVDSLNTGTEYSFRVRAMSKAGPSDESQIATATAADYPGAPRGLQADATQREVALTWTPAAPNGAPITGYELQQDGSAWTEIRGGGSATSTTVTGLNAGATFTFQLRALNIIGAGTAASVTVTTEVVPRPPATGGGGGGGGRTPSRVAKTPTPTPAVPATPATKPTVLPTAVPIATPVPVTPTPVTPAPTPITSVAPPPESTPAPAAGGARRKHRGPAGRFPAQHRPEWHRRDLSARPRPHAGGTGHPSQLPVRRRDP